MTIIADFISRVQAVYKTGAATEHSYRSALETLFNALADGTTALNEPKRVACGAPDFIVQRGEIIVGHAEAKDLGVGLRGMKDANKGQQDLFMAQWLTREAREANTIKRQTPIMCVIGNPPYSGESSNKGDWIMGLMEAYKKEPGGKEKLKERNPKWINDDYVKFIRFAEHLIEKTGEGVLGFITNHGYLDNPTFRGMRWHLLDTFDKIYVLDLHGNTKKKEVTPEGKPDKNVFDIQQGVSIIIGVKRKTSKAKKALATISHAELWGDRAGKYQSLWGTKLDKTFFHTVAPESPQFLFVNRNYDLTKVFDAGFPVQEIFPVGVMGFQSHRDHFAIGWDRDEILYRGTAMREQSVSDHDIATRFDVSSNRDWEIVAARKRIQSDEGWQDKIAFCQYRPMDSRPCYLSEVMMDYPRTELVQNALNRENLFIGIGRQGLAVGPIEWCLVTASIFAMDANLFRRGGLRVSPLYLYPTEQDLDQTRRVNFDPKLYKRLQTLATHPTHGTPNEVAVFDYIYGVLHCPAYRATYAEFLKIDFPRIPWPATPDEFWDISAKGTALRKLHLMDTATIGPAPYPFKGQGDAVVEKPRFEDGKVWINQTQYFDAAPAVSWGFYIGGYQPAQKWLKDRKGRALSFEDVKHYQRILKILSETDRIMATITMELASPEPPI